MTPDPSAEPMGNPDALPAPPGRVAAEDAVLFLDFDGTLVDIADDPDNVVVEPALPAQLAALQNLFSDRVVLVSGRDPEVLRAFLPQFSGPVYGSHGLVLDVKGRQEMTAQNLPDAEVWNDAAKVFCANDDALRYEWKKWGPAIHFRRDPSKEPMVRDFLMSLAGEDDRMAVHEAKCALELRPRAADKGNAIRHAMMTFGWPGKSPVHIGDDTTDESAFEVVGDMGGFGIKVGSGPTAAQYRVDHPSDVQALLSNWSGPHDGQ